VNDPAGKYKPGDFLASAIKAAQDAGSIILDNLGGIAQKDIGRKQTSDYVTRVDRESEQMIVTTLKKRFPSHSFLAEESYTQRDTGGYRWIIDPLDGTTNYIHEYPVFSVSIALEYQGRVIAGVVYDPVRKDIFAAEEGSGAFYNGKRMQVSKVQIFQESLITTGFPFRRKEMIDPYLRAFRRVFLMASDLRRAGSAALDLAYLACGRCEGFFEIGLSPWDMAAGGILIKEAGGMVSDFKGGDAYLDTGNIVAGNPGVYRVLLEEVTRVFAGIIDA
jgi:myo-inositol-1(or 4)-monophosphatase